jgi:hypothetical protein
MTIRDTAIHRPDAKYEAAQRREAFAAALRAWMREAKINNATLSKLCHVGAASVTRWFAGDAMPTEEHMETLERAGFVGPTDGGGK